MIFLFSIDMICQDINFLYLKVFYACVKYYDHDISLEAYWWHDKSFRFSRLWMLYYICLYIKESWPFIVIQKIFSPINTISQRIISECPFMNGFLPSIPSRIDIAMQFQYHFCEKIGIPTKYVALVHIHFCTVIQYSYLIFIHFQ